MLEQELQDKIARLESLVADLLDREPPNDERAAAPPPPSLADIAGEVAKAVTEANEKLRDWEVPFNKFANVSVFNPLGEREHPRPKLTGIYSFMGDVQDGQTLTREEIELWNQIQPGTYPPPPDYVRRGGSREPWIIVNRAPGTDERNYLVKFPVVDDDQRRMLPTMAEILQHFVTNAPARTLVKAG